MTPPRLIDTIFRLNRDNVPGGRSTENRHRIENNLRNDRRRQKVRWRQYRSGGLFHNRRRRRLDLDEGFQKRGLNGAQRHKQFGRRRFGSRQLVCRRMDRLRRVVSQLCKGFGFQVKGFLSRLIDLDDLCRRTLLVGYLPVRAQSHEDGEPKRKIGNNGGSIYTLAPPGRYIFQVDAQTRCRRRQARPPLPAKQAEPVGSRLQGSKQPEGRILERSSQPVRIPDHFYRRIRLSLSAFPITDTELMLIAAAANIGETRIPVKGKRMPAATGTPSAL